MAELLTMPKMGFDMAEGTLVEWVKKEGATLAQGDVVAIIETDKANVEVTTTGSGMLRKILVDSGQVVPVGKAIAVIGGADEDIQTLISTQGSAIAPDQTRKPAVPETEQASDEIGALMAGVPTGRPLASPVARRMAQELGIDLSQVRGTGPGGRIIKVDIETYVRQPVQAVPAPAFVTTPAQADTGVEYAVELLSPIRRTISRRMTESKQQAPHFYVTMEVDMEGAMKLRQQLNAVLPEDDKISVNDLIIKGTAIALGQFPRLNASLAGDEIHMQHYVNVGIAVALEGGLITVVVKDCDRKPLAQIARDAREMVVRAREGRMQADDLVGSTFTISNLGMYGVEDFAAIINPPQAAILAVGAVRRVPVVDETGDLVAGTRAKMCVSADHRVTDGAEVASFMRALKAILEQPMRLVL